MRWLSATGLVAALAVAGLGTGRAAQEAAEPAKFESKAPFAILMDSRSGKIYYENHADDLMAPASMSKVMTMLMVFEGLKSGRLKLTDEFTISENAWRSRRCRVRRVDNVCAAEFQGEARGPDAGRDHPVRQ